METLYAKREATHPWFWVVKDKLGNFIARDRYSNDLRDRFRQPKFNLIFQDDSDYATSSS
jgi:hypothetical protein